MSRYTALRVWNDPRRQPEGCVTSCSGLQVRLSLCPESRSLSVNDLGASSWVMGDFQTICKNISVTGWCTHKHIFMLMLLISHLSVLITAIRNTLVEQYQLVIFTGHAEWFSPQLSFLYKSNWFFILTKIVVLGLSYKTYVYFACNAVRKVIVSLLLCMSLLCCWLLYFPALATDSINTYLLTYFKSFWSQRSRSDAAYSRVAYIRTYVL